MKKEKERKEYCLKCFGESFTVGRCTTKFFIYLLFYYLNFVFILFCIFFFFLKRVEIF